ncbi:MULTISPECIES: glycosyltransferase family 4 protein [unclassified Cyanobium]|uniref:glycosyltransferase family 4 protein n=1 Tax=unclassified Cyanobium TaxID=2627006 RepID=UPI0020CC734F|nr:MULTISPECIES: glycosyltransferase family 4 protein [unclassified Cyanobium]MCP9833657.1 glycosyltransferase family 4 protein [Cyanobium sp. La Preciosa 7G6]MCP9936585.1 glycosyltransferase family 4 protein [Cyanobium sp. Aljojuca 7A6]
MRVLFVSHMATRSGAPLLLLWLLRWLMEHECGIDPAVVLLSDGPLRPEFEALAPTETWSRPLFQPLLKRLTTRLGRGQASSPAGLLEAAVKRHSPDLIYLNTLVLGQHLKGLSADSARPACLSHVHELETTLATMSTPEAVARQLALSTEVVACAARVRQSLHLHHGLPLDRCSVIPGFLHLSPPGDGHPEGGELVGQESLLQPLETALAAGSFVFGFAGQAIPRKGFDLFPLLVRECERIFAGQPFLAVWLGASPQQESVILARRDLQLLGLEHRALLLPPMPSGIAVIRRYAVHGLLSREDPYPLVALEAAASSVPTVCFEGGGGMVEFVADGCGIAVPYLDLEAFAAALLRLSNDQETRRRLGERSRARVLRESSIDDVAPQLLASMQRAVAAGAHCG